ncbi:Uma2 family endonuclease [Plantactinospora sp. KLBMP9567]|uniref:Uma2 family endonuclease n=1 Tax=Plantactinospora sp. KLBMP9567 TaxID=3085900 RepID=UPI0029816086|nr:Uma2 family endonuclease [Plantactinospora sp. KLBMP9567]MDW5323332.1 Uma2 family endonuclease [Plantactinospora sp. KLBMP9567]
MSAEAFGRHLPAVVTLDDLAAMIAADQHGHRYELSPEGALSVMPPPDSEHAAIASRLLVWLAMAGWPAEQVLQAAGIRIPGPDGDGGRIPDLTVWARAQSRSVWLPLADLVLVIEVVSPGSAAMDEVVKRREYAHAGIPRYWLVERDAAQTVTLHVLGPDRAYEVAAKMPLAWLLQTNPADHQVGG